MQQGKKVCLFTCTWNEWPILSVINLLMLLAGVPMLGATKRTKIKICSSIKKKMAFLLQCLIIKYKYRAKSPPLKAPWCAPLCSFGA